MSEIAAHKEVLETGLTAKRGPDIAAVSHLHSHAHAAYSLLPGLTFYSKGARSS